MAIATGVPAPVVDGATMPGPHALVFYQATCSVTAMAGPALARLGEAYPGRVVGVGQDPPDDLARFAEEQSWRYPQVEDAPPYAASDAYEIVSAPTVVVVDGQGTVAAVAESWDRERMNVASATLARLLDAEPAVLSTPDDGLPEFKPG